MQFLLFRPLRRRPVPHHIVRRSYAVGAGRSAVTARRGCDGASQIGNCEQAQNCYWYWNRAATPMSTR